MIQRYIMLGVVALLLLPAIAAAQQNQLYWERYDNFVQVQRDGSVRVREQQTLVVSDAARNRITRSFATGTAGRVTNIRVTVDGQQYRPGNAQPGTFSGNDTGEQAAITVYYADPSVDRHDITIEYTLQNTLIERGDQAVLNWNFFWSGANVPPINGGSVELTLPQPVAAQNLQLAADGVPVQQSATPNGVRWELTEPIRGQQLSVSAAFPRAALAADAQFRAGSGAINPAPQTNSVPRSQPNTSAPQPAPSFSFNPVFCTITLFVLFVAFSIMRSSARRRNVGGYPRQAGYPPSQPGPDPFGPAYGPHSRRRWRRRRGFGGWGGGYGVPPVIIPPLIPPHDQPQQGLPYDTRPDNDGDQSGGGFNSWGDSGGGLGSWGDSGGGSGSWGDSGGGFSSWGGGGGDSGGSSGGGDSGGSGGGSFG